MRAPKLTLTTLVALATLALAATPANAKLGYADVCPLLGTTLCTPGTIIEPGRVAVDNSNGPSAGDVWMTSGGSTPTVVEFDASGNQLAVVGNSNIPPTAPEKWTTNGNNGFSGVAVDPSNGDLYVGRSDNDGSGSVTKFDSAGVFQFQLTGSTTPQGGFWPVAIAVDPSSGDLYVADHQHEEIDKFTASGAYVTQFPISQDYAYENLAVDPNGNLYVTDDNLSGDDNRVSEYSANGSPVDCPGGSNVIYKNPNEGDNGPVPVTVDPSNGALFIGENPASGFEIAEYSKPCTEPFFRFGKGKFGTGGTSGLAVSASTHTVYAAAYLNGDGVIFRQLQLPDVTTGTPATGITRTSAVLKGTIDPQNLKVTGCRFDYGTTMNYGQSVPCVQALPLTGNSPVAVSAEVTGLQLPPGTVVHYRLDETDEVITQFGEDTGEDEQFSTEPLPVPLVTDLPASGVSQFAATLNGMIDTGGGIANYHFEYGPTTAYGSVTPIPDLYTPMSLEGVPVSQSVGGLLAGTTYHYRLVASSPGGTNAVGTDETFTTPPIPAPVVSTGGTGSITTGTATVSGTVDPQGWDTTYYFQYGTSTAYGASWPTVPVDMGALSGAQSVVIELQNLQPGTVYHYRLLASNGGGVTYGPDMAFATAEYPASVIAEPAVLGTVFPNGAPVKTTKQKAKAKAKRHKRTVGRKQSRVKHASRKGKRK
jgi:hypothetical protein